MPCLTIALQVFSTIDALKQGAQSTSPEYRLV
jgi:hypothetical protein